MAIDGVRFGETQMIATGLLFSVAGIAFTYARPVQELAAVHPLGSIFHPAVALSTVGQLAIHLGTMVLAVRMARAATTGEEVGFSFFSCSLLSFQQITQHFSR